MTIENLQRDRDDQPTVPQPAVSSASLTTAAAGERCTSCGSPLAPDQRFCVNCGERRGRSRLSSTMFDAPAAAPGAPAGDSGPRPARGQSGLTVIAFVACLLVAMGLGVLIGHDSAGTKAVSTPAAAASPHITVNAGSGTGTSASSSSSKGTHQSSKALKAAAKAVKATPKAIAKGAAAANKTLGGGSTKLSSPTVKQGGACTGGAGCHNGKFNGQFFGP